MNHQAPGAAPKSHGLYLFFEWRFFSPTALGEHSFGDIMKISFAVLLFHTLASIEAYASGPSAPPKLDPKNERHVIQPKAPDIAQKAGADEFRLWYIAKGTRSEGIHGALCVEGKWITGNEIGETVASKCGAYTWHGTWDDRKMMWAKSGWLPKDLSTIYPSWTLKEKTPNKAADSTAAPVVPPVAHEPRQGQP